MGTERLGHIVRCPICRREVDPLLVTKYDAVRNIPARTVLKCPAECPAVWYIPDYKIEELGENTD